MSADEELYNLLTDVKKSYTDILSTWPRTGWFCRSGDSQKCTENIQEMCKNICKITKDPYNSQIRPILREYFTWLRDEWIILREHCDDTALKKESAPLIGCLQSAVNKF